MALKRLGWWALGLALVLAAGPAGVPGSRPAVAAGECQAVLADGDFETVLPAISPWSQWSAPAAAPGWTPPLPISECRPGACQVLAGVNDPAGPAADGGYFWAWFGGGLTTPLPVSQVVQGLSQTVTVPAQTAPRLTFDLWISRADPGTDASDRLEARLAGQTVFSVSAADAAAYSAYTPVTVDLLTAAPQAGTYTLEFSATTRVRQTPADSGLRPPVINFNVDRVRVCADPLILPYSVFFPIFVATP